MRSLVFFMLSCVSVVSWSQVKVGGRVTDASGGALPFAHVQLREDSLVTIADENGAFMFRVRPGTHELVISFMGYETLTRQIVVHRDTFVVCSMRPQVGQLDEVLVTGQRHGQAEILEGTQTSSTVLTTEDINAIPVLGGEADAIKALQLLPGTIRGIEGTSDLFVRGGAADQNLILLDDVPVYNTSHLFGFLSVFNPDVIEKVTAINGGFPADYGGRLSSVIDIQTFDRVADGTRLSGDIGTLATRLFVETPVVSEKASLWVAGRRTYVDQVVKLVNEELPYFFYDLNGKLIVRPNANNDLSFSFYAGDDFLDYFRDRNNDGDGITTRFFSGNDSQSLAWKKNWMNGWSSKLSLMRTAYRYEVTNSFEDNNLLARSVIEDYGAKLTFRRDSLFGKANTIFGFQWTQHQVSPVVVNTGGFVAEFLESSESQGRIADEFAVHAQQIWSFDSRWMVNAGLRLSMATVADASYAFPEPRLSVRYAIDGNSALKVSYAKMVQYMHRVSSSAASSPTDIWYPVTREVAPQRSHQVALAWQKSIPGSSLFVSAETYYKQLDDLIGYEEGTNLFFNTDFESRLIQGRGEAYGFEFLVKKEAGRFSGWISYTLSWATRRFDAINGGQTFFSRYDRRHNGALVLQYAWKKRWAFSMVFEYISGSRFTPVIGQYAAFAPTLTGIDLIPVFSDINDAKLADTHRLDLGLKFKSKPDKKFQWQWFVGVYNAYNRANPLGINIVQDENDGSLRYEQPGLFGLIPFLNYGFKL